MEQSTYKVSIFFGSSNVFMRRVSCVRACLLFQFFCSFAFAFCFFYVFPLFNSKTNYICIHTGWMHEKESDPSEMSVIIIESAPITHTQTELWRKIAGLHYYIYYGCIHKKSTHPNVLNRDNAPSRSLCLPFSLSLSLWWSITFRLSLC